MLLLFACCLLLAACRLLQQRGTASLPPPVSSLGGLVTPPSTLSCFQTGICASSIADAARLCPIINLNPMPLARVRLCVCAWAAVRTMRTSPTLAFPARAGAVDVRAAVSPSGSALGACLDLSDLHRNYVSIQRPQKPCLRKQLRAARRQSASLTIDNPNRRRRASKPYYTTLPPPPLTHPSRAFSLCALRSPLPHCARV